MIFVAMQEYNITTFIIHKMIIIRCNSYWKRCGLKMTCVNSYRRACDTSIMMFYIVLQDSVETNIVISGSKGYEQFENTKRG
jgi:hypothetical protein